MERGNKVSWLERLSEKQKIGLVLIVVLIVSLAIVLVAVLVTGDGGDSGEIVDVTEGVYTDENGNTVTVETTTNANGDTATTETKEDAYGNVTTTDPNLVTTYFPYQVMREHDEYSATMRYFLDVDERAKVITATVEECDVEGDKALVQEYINSIPIDLSGYTVEYDTFVVDAVCEG